MSRRSRIIRAALRRARRKAKSRRVNAITATLHDLHQWEVVTVRDAVVARWFRFQGYHVEWFGPALWSVSRRL